MTDEKFVEDIKKLAVQNGLDPESNFVNAMAGFFLVQYRHTEDAIIKRYNIEKGKGINKNDNI